MTGMIGDLRDTLLASIAAGARVLLPADDRAPFGSPRRRCRAARWPLNLRGVLSISRPYTAVPGAGDRLLGARPAPCVSMLGLG